MRHRRAKIKSWGYLVVVLATQLAVSASETTYRFLAEGDLSTDTSSTFHGRHLGPAVTHFALQVDGRNWKVRTERDGEDGRTGKSVCDRVVAGSTNADIFSVAYYRERGAQEWTCLGATTRTGPVPYVMLEPGLQMLWIAFIAQSQYGTNGHQGLPATYFPYSPELYEARFDLPADILHRSEPPHFISQLSVFLDKWRSWEGPQRIVCAPPLEKALSPPYQSGCTNFTYSVIEFHQTQGLTWPARFEFTFYGMKNRATNATDLAVMACTQGFVTKFTVNPPAEMASFIPELPRGTLVAEGRFLMETNPVSTFSYFSQGSWPSKSELLKSPEYLNHVHIQKVLKPHANSP